MTEEAKKEENKKKPSRIYNYLIGAASLVAAGAITTIATCEENPTVVRAVVLEEKYVPSKEKSSANEEKDVSESSKEKSDASEGDVSGSLKDLFQVNVYTEKKTSSPPKYMLHIKVYEPTENGEIERLCTLYIKEDAEMPIAVLDEVISAGSEVYVHYYGHGLTLHTKVPLYKIGCFGAASSSEIKVVHPWESSEAVKKSLEDKLESTRQKELERIQLEAKTYDLGRTVF